MRDFILALNLVLICISVSGCSKETSGDLEVIQAAVFKVGRLPVAAVELSTDGALLVAGDVMGVVQVWRVDEKKPFIVLRGHSFEIEDLAFSSNNERIASVAGDNTLRIWSNKGTELQNCSSLGDRFKHVSYGANGEVFTATKIGVVERWDVQSGKGLAVFRTMHSQLKPAVPTQRLGRLGAFATSRDGNRLAIGMHKGVLVVNLTSGQDERWLPVDETQTVFVGFSRDDRRLVVASTSGTIRCIQVPTFEVETTFKLIGGFHACSINGDGTLMAIAEKVGTSRPCAIRLVQLPSGTQLSRWTAHQAAIIDVSFAEDGSLLASGGEDGFVKLWRVPGVAKQSDERLNPSSSH